MIVPMKKVSLIIRGDKKDEALRMLRKLGVVHIEITEGSGEKLSKLQDRRALLERGIYSLGKVKGVEMKEISCSDALRAAGEIEALDEEKRKCQENIISFSAELDRLKDWGDIDPSAFSDLTAKGIGISFFEMPRSEYDKLPDSVRTVRLNKNKSSVKFMLLNSDLKGNNEIASMVNTYRLAMPQASTFEMRKRIAELNMRLGKIDEQILSYGCYIDSMKKAIRSLDKDIELETYVTGMNDESLCNTDGASVSVSYFNGYTETENVEKLKKTASENSWGLLIEEPDKEDNVPTKLKNNRFVSLIYPLTDFLGTVPGYFEYDISGWFLGFILIFFGIIFGDGGYGLLICGALSVPIVKCMVNRRPIPPTLLLIGLFGLSTVVWGTVTCTWFGLSAESLPVWLQNLSIPVISNVYADKIWYPFWTNGEAGLTTAQNLQIFCFSLALIQLAVAHIKGAVRHRDSAKILGDIGSILQLIGIYYLVLNLVVNSAVFGFGLVISGIPVGTVAIMLIGIGFVMSFVFSNYEGSIVKSILSSLTNIVSVLLGVVNVFSDIVSYIRLWAVGLAGAAISATVNELASPLLGNFMFMILAIVLLVFGHGLNMILNILSVIVHGIRLNTLEFSSHLDMSWSGHKFKPFKE